MRLTRETLLKIARDTAAQKVRVSRRIVCIYLTGSLLREDTLLGGATDVDLIFVHDSEPAQPREIVKLSDEVHLDIGHYDQATFHQPRHLRTDPWLGSFIYNKPLVLHDTQHWFEFTQAATGAQFFSPETTLHRAGVLSQAARQAWIGLSLSGSGSHAERLLAYLQAIEDAGNAVACLTGVPITERRFFMLMPQKAQALKRPDVAAGMIWLINDPEIKLDLLWNGWQQGWKDAFTEASKLETRPIRLHSARWHYYSNAASALWDDHPIASLWILLRTWALSASLLPEGAPGMESWQQAQQALKLDEQSLPERLAQMDHVLDLVEETLDTWARETGAA